MRKIFGIGGAVLFILMILPFAAAAQEPTPGSTEPAQPCAVGELCTDFEVGTERSESVNDPPGNHVRSILAITVLALVVGGYLYIALIGKRLPFPSRSKAGA